MLKDRHVASAVVGAHQSRGTTDVLRAEASAHTIRPTGVKWDAHHGNVDILKGNHHVGKSGVSSDARKSRRGLRVSGSVLWHSRTDWLARVGHLDLDNSPRADRPTLLRLAGFVTFLRPPSSAPWLQSCPTSPPARGAAPTPTARPAAPR